MFTKLLPVHLPPLSLFPFFLKKNLHQLPLLNHWWLPPEASSSSHSSPRSHPSIPHQWGAAYPHRSAAIFLQVPARTQTPKHPMQTKSPLALMEPRFAVTDQHRRQNSSWVHRARESCARSPIVRLQRIVFNYVLTWHDRQQALVSIFW